MKPKRFFVVYFGYLISFIFLLSLILSIRSNYGDSENLTTSFQFLTAIGLISTLDLNFSKLVIYYENKSSSCGNVFLSSFLVIYLFGVFVSTAIFSTTVNGFLNWEIHEIVLVILFAGSSSASNLIFTKVEMQDNFNVSTLFRNAFTISPYLVISLGVFINMSFVNILIIAAASRFVILAIIFHFLKAYRSFLNYSCKKNNFLSIIRNEKSVIMIGLFLPIVVYVDRLLASTYLTSTEYSDYIFLSEILFKILASTAVASIILVPRIRHVIRDQNHYSIEVNSYSIFTFLISIYAVFSILFLLFISLADSLSFFKSLSINFEEYKFLFLSYAVNILLQIFSIIQYVKKHTVFFSVSLLINLAFSLFAYIIVINYNLDFTFVILSGSMANLMFNIYYFLRYFKLSKQITFSFFLFSACLVLFISKMLYISYFVSIISILYFIWVLVMDYSKVKKFVGEIF